MVATVRRDRLTNREDYVAQEFSTSIEVRFSDLDAYGHVNSAVYFTYLETARVKLFSRVFQEASDAQLFIVVGKAECTYNIPIMLHDAVQVTVTMPRMGNSSFDLEYRLHDNAGKTYATAKTTMVCFDNVKKAPTRVPELLRELGHHT